MIARPPSRSAGLLALLLALGANGLLARELTVAIGATERAAAKQPGAAQATAENSAPTSLLNEELARELCRRLQAHCRIQYQLFPAILPGVAAGRIQLGFGNFLRTPERERLVGFSVPLWRSSSRLVATVRSIERLKQADGADIRLEALHDLRIAAVQGTQQERYLETIAAAQKLTVVSQTSLGDSRRSLLKGQSDLALMPVRGAYALLSRQPPGLLDFVGPPMAEHGLGGTVHIALPKDDEALRHEVDRAIKALQADGTYQRIVRRHFPVFAF